VSQHRGNHVSLALLSIAFYFTISSAIQMAAAHPRSISASEMNVPREVLSRLRDEYLLIRRENTHKTSRKRNQKSRRVSELMS